MPQRFDFTVDGGCRSLATSRNFFKNAISYEYDPQIEIGVMKVSHPNCFLSTLPKLRVAARMEHLGRKSRFIAPPYSKVPTRFIKEVH